MVSNNNGKACLFAINTTSENISLTVPPLELELYDSTIKTVSVIKTLNEIDDQANLKGRTNKILELLDQSEKDSIKKLITEFSCQFHLPNDKLSKTTMVSHKIPIDQIPINVKEYRYPPQKTGSTRK